MSSSTPDDSRLPLREAGIGLIGERGLYGFSLADVAARAGRSRALVSYHYSSKEAFLDELVRSLLAPPAATGAPSSAPLDDLLVSLSIQYVGGTLDESSGRALLSILSTTHPDARHATEIRNWWK
jgi:AcrR family transcriptional regulator